MEHYNYIVLMFMIFTIMIAISIVILNKYKDKK